MNFYDMFGNFKPVNNNYNLENFASSNTCIINPSDGETCGDLITQIERLKTMVSIGKISDNVQLTNFVDKIKPLVTSDQEIVAFNSLLQTNVQNMSGMSLGGNLAISGVMKAKKYYLSDGTTVKSIIEPEMAVPLDKNGNVILKTNSFVSIESRNPKVILKSNNSDTIDEDDIGNKIAISIDENVPNKLIINQNKNFTNGTQIEGDLTITGELKNKLIDNMHNKFKNMFNKHHNKLISSEIIIKSKNIVEEESSNLGRAMMVQDDKIDTLRINFKEDFKDGTHIDGKLKVSNSIKTKELTLSDTITDSDKFYFQNVGISDNTKKLFKYTDPVSKEYTFFRKIDDVVSVHGFTSMYNVEKSGNDPILVDFKLLKSDDEYKNLSNIEFIDICFTLLEEFNDVVKCFVISYTDSSKTVIESVLFKEQIKNIQQNKNFKQLYIFKNNLETAKSKINRNESLYKNAFKFFISDENNLSIKINKGSVEKIYNIEELLEMITTNAGNITTNAGNITTNAGNITTNTGNITTNTGNITTNANFIKTSSYIFLKNWVANNNPISLININFASDFNNNLPTLFDEFNELTWQNTNNLNKIGSNGQYMHLVNGHLQLQQTGPQISTTFTQFYICKIKQTAASGGSNSWRTFYRNDNNHLTILHPNGALGSYRNTGGGFRNVENNGNTNQGWKFQDNDRWIRLIVVTTSAHKNKYYVDGQKVGQNNYGGTLGNTRLYRIGFNEQSLGKLALAGIIDKTVTNSEIQYLDSLLNNIKDYKNLN